MIKVKQSLAKAQLNSKNIARSLVREGLPVRRARKLEKAHKENIKTMKTVLLDTVKRKRYIKRDMNWSLKLLARVQERMQQFKEM